LSKEYTRMRAIAEANMQVLKDIVPQVASGPKILTEHAPDSGDLDSWMLSNLNSDIFLGLVGLQTIANADDADYIQEFVDIFLRGVKGINGFTVKQLERIAIGMGGAGARKSVKRPGWWGRHVSNRGWQSRAEEEGAEIEE